MLFASERRLGRFVIEQREGDLNRQRHRYGHDHADHTKQKSARQKAEYLGEETVLPGEDSG